MENPFIFGKEVKGEYFADREEEIRELKLAINSCQNILIFSPRRYGKTSLIKKILDELKNQQIITIYIDLYGVTSKEKLAKLIATSYTIGITKKVTTIIEFIKSYIPSISPKLILSDDNKKFELEFNHIEKDIDRVLTNLYPIPQKIAQKYKKKVVVVFDEFQEIPNIDTAHQIERDLRSEIQTHKDVCYCFMGSKKHLITQLFYDKSRPLYRSAKPFYLRKIPRDSFMKFLKSRFSTVKIKISDSCCSKILDLTQCHPYYTQQLSSEIFNITFNKNEVSLTDIDIACEKLITHQSYGYQLIWDELSIVQKRLLIGLAKEKESEGKIFSNQFMQRYNLGALSSVQGAIKTLEKKDIIEKENNRISISDPFFGQWLLKYIM